MFYVYHLFRILHQRCFEMFALQCMLKYIACNNVADRFSYRVLDRSASIDETGYMKWDLCLVLLLAWVLCCLGVIKGVRSSGKVIV